MTNYIGRDLDKISNIEILDNITFDGSQSYTLQKGGVNFTPNSAQSIILGIDGITQIGNFSVNGSTIDFGVAVANTSTCNYIIHLGTGLLTAPSDGSVTNAKLGTAPTLEAKGSGGTAGGVKYFCEQGSHGITLRSPGHSAYSGSYELVLPTAQGGANTFLKNDGSGNLSFASAGGGITEADQYRLTANITSNTDPISSNLERTDDASFAKIGTGMSVSSGIFSFASTGLYLILTKMEGFSSSNDNVILEVYATTDNSSYDRITRIVINGVGNSNIQTGSAFSLVNVTDTSNVKVKFVANSISNGGIQGNTASSDTAFTFIRIGDSQ